MTKPLALVCYEGLLLGSQLVNRLQDLGYRVQTALEPATLPVVAQAEKPLVIVLDLRAGREDLAPVIQQLRQNPETNHIPILSYHALKSPKVAEQAIAAGATLVAGEASVLAHLPQLLDQALEIQ